MKRFHIHLSVADLEANIRFYSNLFGTTPTVVKPDYAKWMLDEPCINFAISNRQNEPGLNHLGLQTDDAEELERIRQHMDAASSSGRLDETNTGCCYAVSNKHWVLDPQGIAWEGFQTLGEIPLFHKGAATHETGNPANDSSKRDTACCTPLALNAENAAGCCAPSPKAEKSNNHCCG